MELMVKGETLGIERAKERIKKYAFRTEPLHFKAPKGPAYGLEPELPDRPQRAYRTFDCVPADPGRDLTPHDVFLISGINGELNQRRVASALAVLPAVNNALRKINEETKFWRLSRTEIAPEGEPVRGTDAWWMHRAWWLLMGAPDIEVTITHKILHHKRPDVFPLIDRSTLAGLGPGRAWLRIHDDLAATPGAWADLEDWFEKLAALSEGVSLTRLRLHDILLWERESPDGSA
ncbi:MAG: DUF6308 family protein [Actinomycetota bacterium]